MERNCRIKIYGWIFRGSIFVHNIPWLMSIFTGWNVSLFAQSTAWNLNQTETKKIHSFRWRSDLSASCTSIKNQSPEPTNIYNKITSAKRGDSDKFQAHPTPKELGSAPGKPWSWGFFLSDPYGIPWNTLCLGGKHHLNAVSFTQPSHSATVSEVAQRATRPARKKENSSKATSWLKGT